MKRLNLPCSPADIKALKVGDEVELFGTIVTARDAAHKLMIERRPDFVRPYLKDGAIYHCGPVMKKSRGKWQVIAAGPTTSIREEPYEATVMEEYGIRVVIGKGGMGKSTLAACKKLGAVYLHAVGGAAVLAADSVHQVQDVFLLDELGVPEAFWVLQVSGFKAVVTMDSKGRSLHAQVEKRSQKNLSALLETTQ